MPIRTRANTHIHSNARARTQMHTNTHGHECAQSDILPDFCDAVVRDVTLSSSTLVSHHHRQSPPPPPPLFYHPHLSSLPPTPHSPPRQSYVTNDFHELIHPHKELLNALVTAHPSTCDVSGPLYFMLTLDTRAHYRVPGIHPSYAPFLASSLAPSFPRECMPDQSPRILTLHPDLCVFVGPSNPLSSSQPPPSMPHLHSFSPTPRHLPHAPAPPTAQHLTSFSTRVVVFRHRVAAHVLADQTSSDRNDWNTAMEVLPCIRIYCRYPQTNTHSHAHIHTHTCSLPLTPSHTCRLHKYRGCHLKNTNAPAPFCPPLLRMRLHVFVLLKRITHISRKSHLKFNEHTNNKRVLPPSLSFPSHSLTSGEKRRDQALRDSIHAFKQSSSIARLRLSIRFEGYARTPAADSRLVLSCTSSRLFARAITCSCHPRKTSLTRIVGMYDRHVSEPATGVGVTREWFHVVARQLFDPHAGYFRYSSGGNSVEIHPGSSKYSNLGGAPSCGWTCTGYPIP
jgi:hypothetical protein